MNAARESMFHRHENDLYRHAVKFDRFQPNYYTLEVAMDYARAQTYYENTGNW